MFSVAKLYPSFNLTKKSRIRGGKSCCDERRPTEKRSLQNTAGAPFAFEIVIRSQTVVGVCQILHVRYSCQVDGVKTLMAGFKMETSRDSRIVSLLIVNYILTVRNQNFEDCGCQGCTP